MNISEDAGKLLLEIYYEKKTSRKITKNIGKWYKKTNWEVHRFTNALEYCINERYLEVTKCFGTDEFNLPKIYINDLTSSAVNLIENAKKSKKGKEQFIVIFNFNANFNFDSFFKGEIKLFSLL